MTLITESLNRCATLICDVSPGCKFSKVLYVENNRIDIRTRFPVPDNCKIISTLTTFMIVHGLTATQWSIIHLKLIEYIKSGDLK